MSPPLRRSFHAVALALSLAALAPLGSTAVDAKAGSGSSFGSRGARTFSQPGFTRTAPGGAAPIQRSETPQGAFGGGAAPAPSRGFGFGSGLAAGLLGAGLFGLLGGGQGFGLLPLLLIGALAFFAFRLFRGRSMPGLAGGPSLRSGLGGGGAPGMGFGSGLGAGGGQRHNAAPLAVTPADFDAFESALVDIQTAYGREDAPALGRLTTPEVFRIFDTDLRANAARGVHNDVRDPRLLQGDLAEAWREGPTDYATVAMRFALRDVTVERASGRVVGGDPSRPTESTELWTFRRDRGGPWLLSAIQQSR
ncbi:Tim44 domain-containing protein [Lichenibacterium dinghuense]|uniref:Tim44 domain-containing protein n=1 Tax=Lichenibacterium dinghuense TaxID=2895977 RepID=UPI001F386689|nr:TIM44-like domain-containing protein [Lichenibacterium sp. 6Y81]